MLEVILEFLAYIIVEIILYYLVLIPGAYIVWIIRGRKTSFKVYFNDYRMEGYLTGLSMWIGALILIYQL